MSLLHLKEFWLKIVLADDKTDLKNSPRHIEGLASNKVKITLESVYQHLKNHTVFETQTAHIQPVNQTEQPTYYILMSGLFQNRIC